MKALIGFGGIGGPEIALHEAGIETLSIELDPAIAEVSRYNGNDVITANILDMDPAAFIGWLLYHFSPPCPSFSVANHASSESELDIALARKICEFIRTGRPEYFTLENVWGYRKSLSWHLIQYTLLEEGYGLDAWRLNSADYGVPQSRKRMIVIARQDGRQPAKPWPMHSKTGDMFTSRWRGWYETIEDLIPGLSETKPAAWQMDRMPEEMVRAFFLGQGQRSELKGRDQPADTVTGNPNQTGVKAFVMASANTESNNSGRWVSMSVRCLARFQDFPDWFVLPGEAGLDENIVLLLDQRTDRELGCRGIGNALPPGMYWAVLKSLAIKQE